MKHPSLGAAAAPQDAGSRRSSWFRAPSCLEPTAQVPLATTLWTVPGPHGVRNGLPTRLPERPVVSSGSNIRGLVAQERSLDIENMFVLWEPPFTETRCMVSLRQTVWWCGGQVLTSTARRNTKVHHRPDRQLISSTTDGRSAHACQDKRRKARQGGVRGCRHVCVLGSLEEGMQWSSTVCAEV
jgi:hypothetical protein